MGAHGRVSLQPQVDLELKDGWGVFRHGESCGVARRRVKSQPSPEELDSRREREVEPARQVWGWGWGESGASVTGNPGGLV